MARPYTKTWKPHNDLIAELQTRGLQVSSPALAESAIRRRGYYRLSGYWYPMRAPIIPTPPKQATIQRHAQFQAGASFGDAMNLYVWDKELRLLLLDAIERIEIAVRVAIADELTKTDPFVHHQKNLSGSGHKALLNHHSFLAQQFRYESRAAKEFFVKHHRREYDCHLPLWAAVEVWDFGMICRFLEIIEPSRIPPISLQFGLYAPTFLSWMQCIRHVRNICSHHGRLWNKSLVYSPAKPDPRQHPAVAHGFGAGAAQSLYPALCVIASLNLGLNANSGWRARMKAHLMRFPASTHIRPADMGLRAGWDTQPLWN